MGIAAYKRTISQTETPRQIERRVLSRATSELDRFRAEYDSAEQGLDRLGILAKGLSNALWQNQRVWLAFQNDLSQESNTLPPNLRASLLSLSIWVDSHTRGVLHGNNKVAPLVDINRTIIRALDGNTMQVME
ncbi:flagellar biosynthesis regulator FlaF [Antarcticimicrobium sediminis]|uniref:Flagellar biosynthesis regulatory protein FlaF n=1 Tax=Antarcticimicrobium sediminis TaxID=2546227 RepID=A0A4R5EVK0_9RHOB|nr:flagellar biosynthesis regulator FlaF [Antarcticimicrobium sediminis]TDE38911.1 flagellar biosynthesis regulatory protein FlaF [Antarcticimicrobium sediminis]